MDTTTAAAWKIGDVVFDSYANPAVVWELDHLGAPRAILQTAGSDRGRVASAGLHAYRRLVRVTDERQAEGARAFGRAEWVRRGEGRLRRLAALRDDDNQAEYDLIAAEEADEEAALAAAEMQASAVPYNGGVPTWRHP